LGCCDLVLGVDWLVNLGDITWNFAKLTMDFRVNGKRHVLRGYVNQKVKTSEEETTHAKTLEGGVHVSMLQLCDASSSLLHALTA